MVDSMHHILKSVKVCCSGSSCTQYSLEYTRAAHPPLNDAACKYDCSKSILTLPLPVEPKARTKFY
uniref:Uncharacterized protein n=1 Tax=Rhizophora mucronata TaxID=61149 RepID=A0A2P2N0M8_RHIMU